MRRVRCGVAPTARVRCACGARPVRVQRACAMLRPSSGVDRSSSASAAHVFVGSMVRSGGERAREVPRFGRAGAPYAGAAVTRSTSPRVASTNQPVGARVSRRYARSCRQRWRRCHLFPPFEGLADEVVGSAQLQDAFWPTLCRGHQPHLALRDHGQGVSGIVDAEQDAAARVAHNGAPVDQGSEVVRFSRRLDVA